MEKASDGMLSKTSKCAKTAKMDHATLATCVSSGEGHKLHEEAGEKTGKHSYVPWVILDGKHNADDNGLLSAICFTIRMKRGKVPAGCKSSLVSTRRLHRPCAATTTVYTLEGVAKTGDCGEVDLPSAYVKPAQAFDKNLKVGKCADAGFTVADGSTSKKVPVVGTLTVRKFKKASFGALKSDSVDFTLYYESFCPGCQQVITEELVNALAADGVADVLNVTLLPYGNAQTSSSGKITCQHGAE